MVTKARKGLDRIPPTGRLTVNLKEHWYIPTHPYHDVPDVGGTPKNFSVKTGRNW